MQTLDSEATPKSVCKIANLILENIDDIIDLSTHQGSRVKKIVKLAQGNWETVDGDIKENSVTLSNSTSCFTQLTKLVVGPFRGFSVQEEFNLESNLVLVYGPNGTGKSSFCEALEYCLLGSVSEAENKRFKDQNEYFKNAFTDNFDSPCLYGKKLNGSTLKIEPNDQAYRFFFVEKNRIDNFSRIAAHLPSKQQELISTLFGLDGFTNFVKNFSKDIDEKYIDINGKKSIELKDKREKLKSSHEIISNNKEALKDIDAEKQELAEKYKSNFSFRDLVNELNGSSESPGRIEEIKLKLSNPPESKSNLKLAELKEAQISILQKITDIEVATNSLESKKDKVSFKQLYEAIISTQSIESDSCPACKTPLKQVSINPYDNAKSELLKLKKLADLQIKFNEDKSLLTEKLKSVIKMINTCLIYNDKENPLNVEAVTRTQDPDINTWHALINTKDSNNTSLWDNLVSQVVQLEERDNKLDEEQKERAKQSTTLSDLESIAKEITGINAREKLLTDQINTAQIEIDKFEEENKIFIEEVNLEKPKIEINKEICAAYNQLVRMLNEYCSKLPEELMSDLEDTIIELYNQFNKNDLKSEKICNIEFPNKGGQRLEAVS